MRVNSFPLLFKHVILTGRCLSFVYLILLSISCNMIFNMTIYVFFYMFSFTCSKSNQIKPFVQKTNTDHLIFSWPTHGNAWNLYCMSKEMNGGFETKHPNSFSGWRLLASLGTHHLEPSPVGSGVLKCFPTLNWKYPFPREKPREKGLRVWVICGFSIIK